MPGRKQTFLAAAAVLCVLVCMAGWLAMGSKALGTPGIRALSGGLSPLDMRPGYTGADADELLDRLGADGRAFYTRYLLIDLFFIVGFAGVQILLANRIARSVTTPVYMSLMALLVLARGAFDLAEDGMILAMIRLHPVLPGTLVRVAAQVTWLKFAALVPWLVMLIAVAFRRMRRRKEKA